ncbi:MAG: heme utilization cystosolic carrier protein HutX [Pseudomonadota bacterium]
MTPDEQAKLRAHLAENADGVLEYVAEAHGVTTFDVVQSLPAHLRALAPGTHISEIIGDMSGWGPMLVVIISKSLVAEIVSPILPVEPGRGFLNFKGSAPFSGHIRQTACQDIAFVARPFFGRPSYSVQFFDADGGSIFKAFVRRGPDGELLSTQIDAFERLRAKYETPSISQTRV